MAGLLNILAGLPSQVGAATPRAYDNQLSPEANAFAGSPAPKPKAPEGFQRPKGLRNTIGTIADILAVMGGQEAGYRAALDRQEAKFNADAQRQAFSNFLANPADQEASRAFNMADPTTAFEVVKALTPKPAAASAETQLFDLMTSNGMSKEQAIQEILDRRRKNAQVVAGAGDSYLLGRDGTPTPLGIGINRAPQRPIATEQGFQMPGDAIGMAPYQAPQREAAAPPMSAFERRGEQIRRTLGDAAYAEFLATGKVTTSTTNPSKGGALASTVGEIRDLYGKLNDAGGMVSPKQGMAANLRERFANSDVGQLLGGAIGTQTQTTRDQLAATLPSLMQQIKQATGMTAAQVNSIPEMRLLQEQVTNPTRSYEAVTATLDSIERRYLGGNRPSAPAAPAVGTVKNGYRFKGGNPASKASWEPVK